MTPFVPIQTSIGKFFLLPIEKDFRTKVFATFQGPLGSDELSALYFGRFKEHLSSCVDESTVPSYSIFEEHSWEYDYDDAQGRISFASFHGRAYRDMVYSISLEHGKAHIGVKISDDFRKHHFGKQNLEEIAGIPLGGLGGLILHAPEYVSSSKISDVTQALRSYSITEESNPLKEREDVQKYVPCILDGLYFKKQDIALRSDFFMGLYDGHFIVKFDDISLASMKEQDAHLGPFLQWATSKMSDINAISELLLLEEILKKRLPIQKELEGLQIMANVSAFQQEGIGRYRTQAQYLYERLLSKRAASGI